MSDIPQLPLDKPLPAPPPPFAGFLQRLAALAIDVVLIYFAGYTLEMALREPLLRLGPFLPFLSHVAAFAYFWLGNGPVGKGATVGKSILNLRVVTQEGNPLGLGASLRRALLQYPLIFLGAYACVAEIGGMPAVGIFISANLIQALANSLVVTLGYAIFTHPQRRGWHDIAAGSYVTPDPPPAKFHEAIASTPDADAIRRQAAQRRTSIVFCLIVVLFFGAQWVLTVADPKTRQAIDFADRINHETPVPGYRLEGFTLFPPQIWKKFGQYYRGQPAPADDRRTTATLHSAQAKAGDAATSGVLKSIASAASDLSDPSDRSTTLLFQYVKVWGDASLADQHDPASNDSIEAVRRRGPEIFSALPLSNDDVTTPPQRFAAVFADRFSFVLFSMGGDRRSAGGLRPAWLCQGPMDTARGPLTYEKVAPAPAETAPAKN